MCFSSLLLSNHLLFHSILHLRIWMICHVLRKAPFSLRLGLAWQKMKSRDCSVKPRIDCEHPARRPLNWNLSQRMTPKMWHYRMLACVWISMQEGKANWAFQESRSYPQINRYNHTSVNETMLPQLRPSRNTWSLIPWSRRLLSLRAKR